VATTLAESGVRAILNFAPVTIRPPEGVVVSNVDMAIELEKLCYYLTNAAPAVSSAEAAEPTAAERRRREEQRGSLASG
jgi:hypothetical protein